MLRTILSVLCLFAVVGFVSAQPKPAEKAGTTVYGKFDSYKDGKLTILVVTKRGEEPKATEFEVKADAKVNVGQPGAAQKTEVAAKEAFGEKLAKGTIVILMIDADKKITNIAIGAVTRRNP